MSKLGENIRKLRIENNLRGEDLGKVLDVTKTAISNWESGKRSPDSHTIIKLANYFNVSVDYLLGLDMSIKNIDEPFGIKIPVLGKVVAGIPIEVVEDIIDYEEISKEMAKTGEFFALQVTGKSMEPRMQDGDVVVVKKQSDIESGDIAIVLINGCDATIKKVIKQDSGLLLVANNQDVYPPKFYSAKDICELPVTIIGKVVELRGKF